MSPLSSAGTIQRVCLPPWTVYYSHGVMSQFWTEDPPCTPPGACTDPETGKSACCTGDCTVIAHDIPRYDLMDGNNPKTGGVVITHAGMPPDAQDPFKCNPDPKTGCYGSRQLTINLGCDQSSKDMTKLTVKGITEPGGSGSCAYVLTATSPAACGSPGDPFDPYRDDPAHSFGFVVLGATLTILMSYTYSFGDNRGWWEPVKNKLAGLPGVGRFFSGGKGVFSGCVLLLLLSLSLACCLLLLTRCDNELSLTSTFLSLWLCLSLSFCSSSSYKTVSASSTTPITASAYGT